MIQNLNSPFEIAEVSCGTCETHCKSKEPTTLLKNLDEQVFTENFNRRPFKIEHNLSSNSLFTLESLIELSQALPADQVEYNAGDLPVTQDPSETPQNGLSIARTIERIENCNSWMVLKNVENDPRYKKLLEDCLAEVQPFAELASKGMTHKQGFIFISSPGSVTPFHIDPENNFLLQVRGTKKVWMFGQNDRHVLAERQIEGFFAGAHRNLDFKEEFRSRGQDFDLLPGKGLHFPVVAPHYVENGQEVSISFSITFQTEDSSDRQTLHRFNRNMRKVGLKPSDVGSNPVADARKLAFLKLMRKAKQWVKKSDH